MKKKAKGNMMAGKKPMMPTMSMMPMGKGMTGDEGLPLVAKKGKKKSRGK